MLTPVHLEPFHRSANPVRPGPPDPGVPLPTATQLPGDVHDTPSSAAPALPGAGGRTGILLQVLPFHESARTELPEFAAAWPTATQYAAVGQDTLPRLPTTLPAGSGGSAVVHLFPFHASASGAAPVPVKYWPTATQRFAVAHDTPSRMTPVEPAGAGSLLGRHALPFQVSASGIPVSLLSR